MFVLLCEYQVPVIRATWFIKLSSAYTINVSEQKIKKRQSYDPTQGKLIHHLLHSVRIILLLLNYIGRRLDHLSIEIYEGATHQITRLLSKSKPIFSFSINGASRRTISGG